MSGGCMVLSCPSLVKTGSHSYRRHWENCPALFLLRFRWRPLLLNRDSKDWMAGRLTLKSRDGRVFRGIEVLLNIGGALQRKILLEHRRRLPRRQLGHGDCLRTASVGQRCRSNSPDVANPLHHTVRRDQPALPVLLNHEHRNRMRLTTLAAAHSQQRRRPYLDSKAQQHRDEGVVQAIDKRSVE